MISIRNSTTHIHTWLDRLDRKMVGFMTLYGISLLRWSIAIVYIWFGALKLLNASPASELVVQTLFWLPPQTALIIVGVWEVLIGLGLLSTNPFILRATLFLLWLQIAGTFQVLILLPHVVFQGGNPLLPTLEGQYAIKNLVLITAGLVIGSTVRRSGTSRSPTRHSRLSRMPRWIRRRKLPKF
jgi:uncharacterized membrane protein YkgB